MGIVTYHGYFFVWSQKGVGLSILVLGSIPLKPHLSSLFVFGKQPSLKGGSDGSDQSDEGDGEVEQLAAEEAAVKERKRAGLPEITPDTLNSSIANKMLTLSPRNPFPKNPIDLLRIKI